MPGYEPHRDVRDPNGHRRWPSSMLSASPKIRATISRSMDLIFLRAPSLSASVARRSVSRRRPWACSWMSAMASELKISRSQPAQRRRCAMYSAVSPTVASPTERRVWILDHRERFLVSARR